MFIPPAVALGDLPTEGGSRAKRRGLFPRRRPSPSIAVRTRFEPTLHDLTGLVDPAGGADELPQEHFLHYRQYETRRFVVAEGRDVVLVRDAKAPAAPGFGFIDEFNVGGARGIPPHLFDNDLRRVDGGFEVADAAVKRLPGVSVPFCHYGQTAFGHFVLDGLLQVYLFRREIADGARLAHWLPPLPWMAPILERCGVPARQRPEIGAGVVLLERALLSSALAGQGVYFPGPWSADFFSWLRSVFLDRPVEGSGGGGVERIYLRRQNAYARRVGNAEALEDLARDHGFRPVTPEDLSFAEQVRLFAEAGTVLSPWGSTLTLAPLLGGPRQVVELLPGSVDDAWFLRQAAVHGLRYLPVIHPSTPEGDFEADLNRIDRLLAALPA